MSVAVIIPAYFPNEEKTILDTLNHFISKVNGVYKINLFLTWNGVIDSLLLSKINSICQVINNPRSNSKAENINSAIEKTKNYEYICIYDADARPENDSVYKLKNCIEKDPKIGFVQGRFIFDRGNNLFIRLYDVLENRINDEIISPIKFRGHDAIFRRKVLLEVGGFDIFSLSEDSEITLRILEKGYIGKFLADHFSSSESPSTLKSFLKQRLRWISGGYQLGYSTILARLIVSVLWISLYYFFFLETIVTSFILGLAITQNITLAILFLIYPIITFLLVIYFFINGVPTYFKVTTRAGINKTYKD